MNPRKILFIFLTFINSCLYADEHHRTEEYLHNYGISHCLSFQKTDQEEGSLAKGGYFQMGEHSIEDQKQIENFIDQQQIENFIDQQLKINLNSYQYISTPAYLMRCLEISYSKEYREYVRYILDITH